MVDQKVAVVTGASRGIGAAIAAQFNDNGYMVACVSRHGKVPKVLKGKLVKGFTADVSSYDQVHELSRVLKEEFGTVNVLVNNAGIIEHAPGENYQDQCARFTRVLMNNLASVHFVTTALIPLLHNHGSRIVNISSIAGITGYYGHADYAASKAGIIAATKTWAKEFAPWATCNAICPGAIETDMMCDLSEVDRKRVTEKIPLRRFGTPQEVASLVHFLCESEGGKYITGQVFTIDGGMTH